MISFSSVGKGKNLNYSETLKLRNREMEIYLAPDSASGYVHPKATCEHLDEHVKIVECVSVGIKFNIWTIYLKSHIKRNRPKMQWMWHGQRDMAVPSVWPVLLVNIWSWSKNYLFKSGRFINRHMVDHAMKDYHLLAMSLSDLSFWCYVCDCYIINTNPTLMPIYASAHLLKFNVPCPNY